MKDTVHVCVFCRAMFSVAGHKHGGSIIIKNRTGPGAVYTDAVDWETRVKYCPVCGKELAIKPAYMIDEYNEYADKKAKVAASREKAKKARTKQKGRK